MASATRYAGFVEFDNGDTLSEPIIPYQVVYHDYGSAGCTFKLVNEASEAVYVNSTKAGDTELGPVIVPLQGTGRLNLKAVLTDGKLDVYYR